MFCTLIVVGQFCLVFHIYLSVFLCLFSLELSPEISSVDIPPHHLFFPYGFDELITLESINALVIPTKLQPIKL